MRRRPPRQGEPHAHSSCLVRPELDPDGRDTGSRTGDERLDPDLRAPGPVHPVVRGTGRPGPHVDRLPVALNRALRLRLGAEPPVAVEHADAVPGGQRGDARDVAGAVLVEPRRERGLGADSERGDHDADAAVADEGRRRARRIVCGEQEGRVSRLEWQCSLRVETNGDESVTAPESDRGQHSRRYHPASPLRQLRAAVAPVRSLRSRTSPTPGTAEAGWAGRERSRPCSPPAGCLPPALCLGTHSGGRR